MCSYRVVIAIYWEKPIKYAGKQAVTRGTEVGKILRNAITRRGGSGGLASRDYLLRM